MMFLSVFLFDAVMVVWGPRVLEKMMTILSVSLFVAVLVVRGPRAMSVFRWDLGCL